MGKMANLLAKLCEKPESDERPPGLKRKSTFDVSDNSDSVTEENSRKSGKRRRYVSNSEGNISLYASEELEDADFDDIKCSPSVLRPPAEMSGKQPLMRLNSFKTLSTVLTRMTPPAIKSSKYWRILL